VHKNDLIENSLVRRTGFGDTSPLRSISASQLPMNRTYKGDENEKEVRDRPGLVCDSEMMTNAPTLMVSNICSHFIR
jgi:hypothetical protein